MRRVEKLSKEYINRRAVMASGMLRIMGSTKLPRHGSMHDPCRRQQHRQQNRMPKKKMKKTPAVGFLAGKKITVTMQPPKPFERETKRELEK